jgi:hypothetical protein
LANEVRERASPLIRFDASQAVRHSKKLYLSLDESEYLEETLKHLYPDYPRRNQVKRTDFLDRHAFSTVTIIDSLPLPALRPYQKAFTDYLSVPDKTRSQLHLFAAERNAAIFESMLTSIKEPKRPFHPRFISQLEHLERTRAFALCVIYGLISDALDADNNRYRLEISDQHGSNIYDLTPRSQTEGKQENPTLLSALQVFVQGKSQGERPDSIPFDRIQSALVSRRKAEAENLKQTFKKREAELEARKEDKNLAGAERDVISYIHLVLRDEMKIRG